MAARSRRGFGPTERLLLPAAEATVLLALSLTTMFVWGRHAAGQAGASIAWPALALSSLALIAIHAARGDDPDRRPDPFESFVRLGGALAATYVTAAALGYHLTAWFDLGRALPLFCLLAVPAIHALRLTFDALAPPARSRRRVLLWGGGQAMRVVADAIRARDRMHEVIGRLDEPSAAVADGDEAVPALGAPQNLAWAVKVFHPDVIVVAGHDQRGTLPVADLLDERLAGVEIADWASFYERFTGRVPVPEVRPSWLLGAPVSSAGSLTLATKRTLDVVVSLVGCFTCLPLMAVIAIVVRLDSRGPALFQQERVGQGGRVFRTLKFRSMTTNSTAGGPDLPRDRVTRVGRILRRTRLDELPQLFNVLAGQMSLVGPRPEWVFLVPEFQTRIPFYLQRLAVKPGLTGWAQVNHPYGTDVENAMQKLQYDLYYVKHIGILLDLVILLRTVPALLFTRGSR